MEVAIAGGHGKIALRLARLLAARGDRAVGLIRRAEQADDLRAAGAEPEICDLEEAGVDEIGLAVEGADAVVFAAGAGPGSGPARKETMDHGGAVKLIEAARSAGVRRYLMISAMGAVDPPDGDDTFSVYLRAKARADEALRASDLDHVIVRPGLLTDDPGTGLVAVGERLDRGEISRDDVAAVLLAVLDAPQVSGVSFDLVAGHQPIEAAVAGLAGGADPLIGAL